MRHNTHHSLADMLLIYLFAVVSDRLCGPMWSRMVDPSWNGSSLFYEKAKGQDRVMLITFLHLAGWKGETFRLKWSDVDWENN